MIGCFYDFLLRFEVIYLENVFTHMHFVNPRQLIVLIDYSINGKKETIMWRLRTRLTLTAIADYESAK